MRRLILVFISLLCSASVFLAGTALAGTREDTEVLLDGIISFKLNESGCSSVQQFADSKLSENAGKGSSEWYAIGLSQYYRNIDLSGYSSALLSYLSTNSISSATSRQRCALALIACQKGDDPYVSSTSQDSVGNQGIMSYIYGLQLASNGAFVSLSKEEIISSILSMRKSDGGWAVSGTVSDVDVTAMALTALSPYKNDPTVSSAIENALTFLSSRQLEDGGFMSYGKENAESSAQVITALTALSVNPKTDVRFIKNGNSPLSGMTKFRLSDGSFCHIFGGESNPSATVQAFYSLVALYRYEKGLPSLFSLSVKGKKSLDPISSDSDCSTKQNGSGSSLLSDDRTAEQNSNLQGSEEISGQTEDQIYLKEQNDGSISDCLPSLSVTPSTVEEQSENQSKGFFSGYKPWVILGIIAVAAVLSLILWLKKIRSTKNFVLIGALAGLLSLAILFTNFSSARDYYSPVSKTDTVGSVTLTIRCDTILEKSDNSRIPKDGIILPQTEIALCEGETVFDILTDAAKTYGIQVENSGVNGDSKSLAYIKGINYIYEFEAGQLSGWVYRVNGQIPSVGCGEYVLSPQDSVEWLYTCDLGNDLDRKE